MRTIRICLATAICLAAVSVASAETVYYGWEDGVGDAVLGTYGNVGSAEFSTEQARAGDYSLKVTEDPIGGTPQVYLAWVTGLQEGDVVTASVYIQSHNGAADEPKGRLWGHYTTSEDINAYQGSASGPSTYAGATDWDCSAHSWTVAAGQEALVIEGRIYSDSDPGNNVIYFDDLCVIAPDGASITVVPEPATIAMLLAGLAAVGFLRRT